MPLENSFGPGNIYQELSRIAKMAVVPGVTVGSLVYASCRDLYSKAYFSLGLQVITANTEVDFFSEPIGKIGSGWTTAQTLSQTNFTGNKGQMPANQVYVMTHLGFSVEAVSDADPASVIEQNPVASLNALHTIIEAFTVQLNIGRGTNRTIGKLADFPQASMGWGVWADNAGSATSLPQTNWATNASNGRPDGLVRLPIPIIFPPLVDVSIKAISGAGVTIASTDAESGARFAICAHAHGFEMTMPV